MEAAAQEILASGDAAMAAADAGRLDGAVVDLGELGAACRSLPFLGGKRVIVVVGLGARLKAAAKDDVAQIREAVEGMPPSTELVVLEATEKRQQPSGPLWELAQRLGETRAFNLVDDGDVRAWIAREVGEQGSAIDREAAAELYRRVGDDALQLRAEVDKLVTFSLDEGRIGVETVRRLVPLSAESSVFDLVDAIGRRDPTTALGLAQDLMVRQSEAAPAVLAMIGRQFRLLLMVQDLLAAGTPPEQIARTISLPAWLVRRLVEQSRRFSAPELDSALERVMYADFAAKGGADLSDVAVVLGLVAELTGGR